MEFKIKYYKDLVSFHIPDQNVLGNILPNTAPAAVSEAEEVARALSVPFGTPRLSEIVRSGEKIVIVTSDITRPVPSKIIIPRLLDELGKAGVKDEGGYALYKGDWAANNKDAQYTNFEIGRASCREECRSRWSPYH